MTDSFNQPGFLNFVIANYSGARPWIADFSGLPIETLEWSGQRYLKAWISGQAVTTTVNVDLSGASFASNVSGNIVYLTSGQNAVQNSGQVVYLASGFNEIAGSFTANVSGQPVNVSGNAVRISGQTVIALISGQTVIASVTTNVSGQIVYLTSGQNPVQISGQAVRISGETIQIAGGINVSGSPVRISGETIYSVSGLAFTQAFDPSGQTWLDAWTNASGQHRILVAISGESLTAFTSISGNVVLTSVSGNAVIATTSVSGNMVSVSGQAVTVSGNVVKISGETVQIAGGVSVSGNVVLISGQVLYPVSGKSYTQGFDSSGQIWNDIWVSESGGHRLLVSTSGETLLVSVSGNMVSISGQPVSVSGNMVSVSGQPVRVSGNMVSISGQSISVSGNAVRVSGETIIVPSTSVSGNAVRISGETVQIAGGVSVSGNAVRVSGETIYPVSGKAYMQIFDPSGAQYVDLWNASSGSHNLAITAQVTTDISGQTVYLVSGNNPVQLYAFDPSGVALRPLIVNASGSNILRVDAGAIQVAANVSGNVVYLTSGQNAVQISGQPVLISGQLVAVSGIVGTSVSGNAVRTSGEVSYPVSGKAYNQAFDPSGVTWNDIWVSVSGGHRILVATSGETVLTSVSGNMVSVSGQPALVSGQLVAVSGVVSTSVSGNMVSVSGQPVRISGSMVSISGQAISISGNVVQISGQLVAVSGTVAASVSGNMVSISGQPVSVSGNAIRISGQTIYPVSGLAFMQAFDPSGTTWNDVWVAQSGSHRILAAISGETVVASVTTNISGQVVYLASGNNAVQISGQTVVANVTTNISGQGVRTVPEGSGITIRTASGLMCTSLSGGTALPSLVADRVTIRMNPDHSGRMYLGSTTNPPFSGMGFVLAPGDGITLQAANTNLFQVFATTSGEQVFFIAEDT